MAEKIEQLATEPLQVIICPEAKQMFVDSADVSENWFTLKTEYIRVDIGNSKRIVIPEDREATNEELTRHSMQWMDEE